MAELVSVLIPAYNAEQWIAETVNSALRQTWPNTEIIIVDDGSSDDTLRIARQFESKSVKVATQQNMGASTARNKALSLAQGDYIQWLDADDLLAPEKISDQLKFAGEGRKTAVLLSSAFGMFYYRHNKARFMPSPLWRDLKPVEWLLIRFVENVWMSPAVWLVNRKLTELVGSWDQRLSLDDDGEYFCRVVAASEEVKFAPRALSYYRVGNLGSLSMTKSDEALGSLSLAISLSVKHLLSLEDSPRTRLACLSYLQNRFGYFYPDKKELIKKVCALAQQLGGDVLAPKESWRFHLMRKMVGWNTAMNIKNIAWVVETLAARKWDKLFCNSFIARRSE